MAATQLIVEHQPNSPIVSGDDFMVPVVIAADGSGNRDSAYNGTITATWVPLTGTSVASGTFAVLPLVGRSWFYDVFVTGTAGATGRWDFSAPGLTGVSSNVVTINASPTATKLGYGTRTQSDGYTGSLTYFRAPSQENEIAATGVTFDYRILIEAQNALGVRDTTFTGAITATVASGTCTLGGTVTRNCIRGQADFSDLKPATGTGPLSITFSGGGLTPFTTAVMDVVTPEWDIYQYAPGQFVLVEQPRRNVDKTYPTSFSAEYTVDPTGTNTGNNRTTINGIIAKIVADNPTTDVRVKVSPATYNEVINLLGKPSLTGLICFEPLDGIPGTPGVRITAAEVAAKGVKFISDVGNNYTIRGNGEGHNYRFSGIEVTQNWTTSGFFAFALISFTGFQDAVDPANPPTIKQVPKNNGFDRCWIHGEANRGLRKGVIDDGSYNFVVNSIIDEVHALRSPDQGSGDENAICAVGAIGPCLYENNALRSTGECILYGGSNPTIYDRKSRDITIRRNFSIAPLEWQTLYKHKNHLELKSADRMLIECNIFDGAWNGNQDGAGIRFGSGNQYGGKIYNYEGNSNITFRYNFCRNMHAWFSLYEQISPDSFPLQTIAIHDNLAVNINDPRTWVNTNGTRASATELHQFTALSGSSNIAWSHNTQLASEDPATKYIRFLYTDKDNPTSLGFFRDCIATCQGYGVIAGNGGVGSAAVAQGLPDSTDFTNVLIAGANDGSNYAAGAVHGSGMSSLGVQFPPEAYYPTTIFDVGFVDPTINTSWDTADPDVVMAALALSSSSLYKSVASDGTDPGANITTLRSKLSNVWVGGIEGGGGGGGGGGPAPTPNRGVNKLHRRCRLI